MLRTDEWPSQPQATSDRAALNEVPAFPVLQAEIPTYFQNLDPDHAAFAWAPASGMPPSASAALRARPRRPR